MPKRTKVLPKVGVAKQPPHPKAPHRARGAFYFDPSSERQKASAIAWADGDWVFDPPNHYRTTGQWVLTRPMGTKGPRAFVPEIQPNAPMSGLLFMDIDVRLEGGRAYKVVDPRNNSLFDVREDQMVQAILKYGIAPGGLIGGEWVWAMNHNQIKCYLLDGAEYQEILKEHGFSIHSEVISQ